MAAKKCPELTVMSGIAIIFVLLIHACGYCLAYLYPGMEYAETDTFLLTLRNLVTPAVPMFLFVSGFKYALHDSDTPYREFLKKRLPKVLMSFFIINTIFWIIDSIIWMERFDAVLLLKTYISSWLGNSVAYPLWYIPMYCCVVIACPLACRIIQNCWVRLLLYLAVGCAQRLLAVRVPMLGAYPFLFVSYPLFFELGIIVHQYDFTSKLKGKAWLSLVYIGVGIVLSAVAPRLSSVVLVQYVLFCVVGTLAYFTACIFLSGNKVFSWIGLYSYPLFLLHEPVIGRCAAFIQEKGGLRSSPPFIVLWLLIVFFVTIGLIKLLEFIKVDTILWKYSRSKWRKA